MAKKKQSKQRGQQFLSDENYLRQRARKLEIGKCYITDNVSEGGMDDIIVTRLHTGGRISIGCYVVDNYCLGVKDSFYRLRIEDFELQDYIHNLHNGLTFKECSYEEAHNRIYGAIAFAEEAGIAPDKSFALTQYLLEEDTDDIPLIEYEYGKDGKHLLICQTQLEASKYLPLLEKNLGKGNYDYIIGIGDEPDDYDDDISYYVDMHDILEGYDKEVVQDMAADFGLELDDSLSEKETRDAYINLILKAPEKILLCLSRNDLSLLEEIVDEDGDYLETDLEDNGLLPLIIKYGFAEEFYDIHDNRRIRVADDFFAAVKPHLEDVQKQEVRMYLNVVENAVEGLANLYGHVSVDVVRQYMQKKLGLESDKTESLFDPTRNLSLLLKSMEKPLNPKVGAGTEQSEEQLCYVSRFCHVSVTKLQEHIARYDEQVPSPKEFSDDQVMSAGTEYPVIPNARQRAFDDFLNKKLGLSHYLAWYYGFQLWYRVQHEHEGILDLESAEDYFRDTVLEMARKPVNQKVEQEAMQMLRDYLRHMPRWSLKGHSPYSANVEV